MANLTSKQANRLAEEFYLLALSIGDFRYENWDTLSLEENKKLSGIQAEILRTGEDILALSTTLVMDEVGETLEKITSITSDIKGTISSLRAIQKGMDTAAAILALGSSILRRDPGAIGNSLKGLFAVWKPTDAEA
jgi:hypothetical protein